MARAPTRPAAPQRTLADLLNQLGGIPPRRVRLDPTPGAATEADVLNADRHDGRLCELIDGVLVEKTMGFEESRLALLIAYHLQAFVMRHDLGIVAGEAGMLRLVPGLVRIPDVSFISWTRYRACATRKAPIPDLAPDLAIEVLSNGNTKREMRRKLLEYFDAGAQLVWLVDPKVRTVRVHTAPDHSTLTVEDGALDGGDVLPGFTLALRDLFAEADRQGPRGA